MRKLLLVSLCALFAAFVWKSIVEDARPRGADHPWTHASDPFEPGVLRVRMERLAPIVSKVVGHPIDVAPLRIRAADDRLVAERELAAESPHVLDTTSDAFSAKAVSYALARESRWSNYLGSYDSETDTIELYPYQFDAIVPDSIDAVIDLVIAHELAHAWQDQRFGLLGEREPPSRESAFARRAVVEGSAEFVARRVARELGTSAVFDRITAVRQRGAQMAGAGRRSRLTRQWFYVEGLAFVEAVSEAWGGTPDWSGLFSQLPQEVAVIERSRDWLDPARPGVETVDDKAERFFREVGGDPPDAPHLREWGHLPIPPSGLRDRLGRAAIPVDDPTWSDCRGGVLLNGMPSTGGLVHTDVSIRVWRLGSPEKARMARASLEQAAGQRGATSWVQDSFIEFSGRVRRRDGRSGATAYSQSGMDESTGELEEEICALGTEGPWLLEATSNRVGAAPALLELLESAVRSWGAASSTARRLEGDAKGPWGLPADAPPSMRDRLIARALSSAGGERDVQAWLRSRTDEPGAFLAALGPAADEGRRHTPERGESIVAALRHEDADVRRFALNGLGSGDVEVRPFSLGILPLIREAARDPAAELRALAVQAAHALESEEVLGRQRIRILLSDPSPFVRAALARCSSLLEDCEIEQLRGDENRIVRSALKADRGTSLGGRLWLFERMARYALSWTALQSYQELDSLFALDWDELSAEQRRTRLAQLRRLLRAEDDHVRMGAIWITRQVSGDRSSLVSGLLDAFASGPHRRAATGALLEEDFDLKPHRSRLVRMLDNPFCKVDVLRVLAAKDVALPTAVAREVRSWLESPNDALACAAALALLDGDALDKRWTSVHLEFRTQIVDTVLRHHPDSPLAARMRARALMSPYRDEREAVFESLESRRHIAAHWEALLTRIAAGGSEVAGECWADLADRIGMLSSVDAAEAVAILSRHLNAWCERDKLPLLSWRERTVYSWDFDDWPADRAFVAALDRCILRTDAPPTRLIFTLIREAITDGEIPRPVQDAMRRLFAASPFPGIPAAEDTHKAAVRRAFVPADTVCHLLRQRANEPDRRWSRFRMSVELVGHGADRERAAHGLIREFLERDDARHVSTALRILSELGTATSAELAQLRESSARALPSWRKRIEDCVSRLK